MRATTQSLEALGHMQHFIFDMDGTLIDSMWYWRHLGRLYLETLGYDPSAIEPNLDELVTLQQVADYCRDFLRLPLAPEEISEGIHRIIAEKYEKAVTLKAGVAEYLMALKAREAKICIATATPSALAEPCLSRLGVRSHFEFMLSCKDMDTSKRCPDIYLMAAERLSAPPSEIAVFEDALYAAHTAKAAGFFTVGIFDEDSLEDQPALRELSDVYISGFAELQ